ncbi:MAG: biotin/lipoyl-binding protein, partial [Candidatus Omnitrophica bacterium]|nr:biotin/lipoyl-binding protein [Candidatus Omnitrophota bacterium]
MRKKGYVIFGFIVVLLTGCSSRKDITSLTFSGTLEIEEHSLGAPVSGRIKDILVEEGQGVKAGQPIAFLEHYEQAKRDFERSEALLDSGGVSREQYEHDRQTMDDQQILSPIDGVVLLKVRESGEVVAAGA